MAFSSPRWDSDPLEVGEVMRAGRPYMFSALAYVRTSTYVCCRFFLYFSDSKAVALSSCDVGVTVTLRVCLGYNL